jgi:hypothetical protein
MKNEKSFLKTQGKCKKKMSSAVSALEKTKPTISIVGAKKTVKTVLITCFFIPHD